MVNFYYIHYIYRFRYKLIFLRNITGTWHIEKKITSELSKIKTVKRTRTPLATHKGRQACKTLVARETPDKDYR